MFNRFVTYWYNVYAVCRRTSPCWQPYLSHVSHALGHHSTPLETLRLRDDSFVFDEDSQLRTTVDGAGLHVMLSVSTDCIYPSQPHCPAVSDSDRFPTYCKIPKKNSKLHSKLSSKVKRSLSLKYQTRNTKEVVVPV